MENKYIVSVDLASYGGDSTVYSIIRGGEITKVVISKPGGPRNSFEGQLKAYRKALRSYQKSKYFGRKKYNTDAGFCKYFGNTPEKYSIGELSVLMTLKPSIYTQNNGLWFKAGQLEPRIELLKTAIEICGKEIRVMDRSIWDKVKGVFLCGFLRGGHTISKIHPKYPSEYCGVCSKHRAEF